MARKLVQDKPKPPINIQFVHPLKEFETILRYERARADRSGNRFAVIALEVQGYFKQKKELIRLLKSLRARIRDTDQLGWLDDRTVGVLLPDTDLEGGWKFIVDFGREYFVQRRPASFTVYCYPEHWLHNGNGTGARGKSDELAMKYKYARFQMVCQKVECAIACETPMWKRILDITGSLLGLLSSSPIFLILSAYIKFVSPGPVFFKQRRVGYRGKLFTFLKFRTMGMNNSTGSHRAYLKDLINSDKPMEKLDEGRDPRIIFGGRIIRKACLDELPQLINVLKGEMSLVGPRPCLPYEAAEYLRWHNNRFDIRPGITGLWQVSGKNRLTFNQMIRLDISYLRNLSLWLDLKILILTFPAIVQFVLDAVARRIRGRNEFKRPSVEHEPLAICQVLETFAERF